MIKNITIVGGTHGNESTGIYLLKKWQQQPIKSELNIGYLLANPKAFAENRRYLERDLNRSFKQSDLDNPNLTGYENLRAKDINQQLGLKDKNQEKSKDKNNFKSKTDFIIDLHTSTAPMGVNLVLLKADFFHLKLVDFVQQRMPAVTITWEEIPDHHFLMSISDKQILIEVGATPQNVLRQDVFEQTEQAVKHILKFLELYNQQQLPTPSTEVEVYKYFDVAYLPQNAAGEIIGMVHRNIQDRDFRMLRNGEPIFKLLNGEEILYQGEDCYISFINEAAYYDEKKAFSMSQKMHLAITD